MIARAALRLLGATLLLLEVQPGSADESGCGPFRFRDAASALGLDFVHHSGASEEKHLPETMGAGVAWLDYDDDGWWDLYVVQSGPFPPDGSPLAADRLFRNIDGGGFVEVPLPGGPDRGNGQGAFPADTDGDGDVDLYVTNFGPDGLLLNHGRGGFEIASDTTGLALDGWSSSAAWADADADGDLDLYVSRYVEYDPDASIFCGDPVTGRRRYCDPSIFAGAEDRFYRNLGDGRFVDATDEAGLAAAHGRGLGVLFADLDGDLQPDLYVANDLNPNFLFVNRGDGTFQDVSLFSGSAVNREGRPEAGMGVMIGDIDGDADPDLAVTNFDVETNTLYRNQGNLMFEDVSAVSGFGLPSFNALAFGVVAADFDRDGALDVYVANGHIFDDPARENVSYRQPDQVLAGDGVGGFTLVPCELLDASPTVARGLAVGDADNDGDPDLAVQENGGPLRLLLNDAAAGDSWLGVKLRGAGPNTEGIGAVVDVRSTDGAQRRWVVAGDSYQSSSDRRPLFGFGAEKPTSLKVLWRAGTGVEFRGLPADRYLVVFEPHGR